MSYYCKKGNNPRLKLKIQTYPSPLARSIFSIYNFRITTFFELTVYTYIVDYKVDPENFHSEKYIYTGCSPPQKKYSCLIRDNFSTSKVVKPK